jgi:hypothetical protein
LFRRFKEFLGFRGKGQLDGWGLNGGIGKDEEENYWNWIQHSDTSWKARLRSAVRD